MGTVCVFLLQFDFSIFNDSVKPQFSDPRMKKYPRIRSTYEVVGVPDMFIGIYIIIMHTIY